MSTSALKAPVTCDLGISQGSPQSRLCRQSVSAAAAPCSQVWRGESLYTHTQQSTPSPRRSERNREGSRRAEPPELSACRGSISNHGWGCGKDYLFCRPLGGQGGRYLGQAKLHSEAPSPKVIADQRARPTTAAPHAFSTRIHIHLHPDMNEPLWGHGPLGWSHAFSLLALVMLWRAPLSPEAHSAASC